MSREAHQEKEARETITPQKVTDVCAWTEVTERFEMCGFIGYADRLAGEAFATASVTSVDDLIQVNFERRATRRSLLSSGAESVASLSVASRSSTTTKQAIARV